MAVELETVIVYEDNREAQETLDRLNQYSAALQDEIEFLDDTRENIVFSAYETIELPEFSQYEDLAGLGDLSDELAALIDQDFQDFTAEVWEEWASDLVDSLDDLIAQEFQEVQSALASSQTAYSSNESLIKW